MCIFVYQKQHAESSTRINIWLTFCSENRYMRGVFMSLSFPILRQLKQKKVSSNGRAIFGQLPDIDNDDNAIRSPSITSKSAIFHPFLLLNKRRNSHHNLQQFIHREMARVVLHNSKQFSNGWQIFVNDVFFTWDAYQFSGLYLHLHCESVTLAGACVWL